MLPEDEDNVEQEIETIALESDGNVDDREYNIEDDIDDAAGAEPKKLGRRCRRKKTERRGQAKRVRYSVAEKLAMIEDEANKGGHHHAYSTMYLSHRALRTSPGRTQEPVMALCIWCPCACCPCRR